VLPRYQLQSGVATLPAIKLCCHVTSYKAVLPRYLLQGGANFEFHFPFFSKNK
jgi:hypothetical protein